MLSQNYNGRNDNDRWFYDINRFLEIPEMIKSVFNSFLRDLTLILEVNPNLRKKLFKSLVLQIQIMIILLLHWNKLKNYKKFIITT